MQYEIIIAGFGGQGVLSAGRLLAYAGMIEGKNVSWLPSYGPEMRGGTANCHVIISDDEVGSPIINHADIAICMNLPSFEKFEKLVKDDGFILADSSMIEPLKLASSHKKHHDINATERAFELGNKAYANIFILGKLLAVTKMLTPESIEQALYKVLPPKKHNLIPIEMKALKTGMEN
ncbi:MAG: 2-oxoacid:acceptor oxidoreductase family protein [Clostridia bacterium]|nr:2-oxoacid:acceptor oxidoreductase family protein [Clostridia bacterium]